LSFKDNLSKNSLVDANVSIHFAEKPISLFLSYMDFADLKYPNSKSLLVAKKLK